jgi:hypothetical protein
VWLKPIIQATREAGIKRTADFRRSQLNQWVWWHMPVIPDTWGSTYVRIMVQAGLSRKQDPVSKVTHGKRAGSVLKW